nr:aminoglycoside phosphotransferase family protein [Friedmanniella luteola]
MRWGGSLAVKVPHRDQQAIRACLVHAQVSSAARLLGVSAPEIVAVVDLDPIIGVPVIVSRFLPGHRLSPGRGTPQVWAAVGAEIRVLHRASAAQMPPGLRSFTQTGDVDPRVLAERLRAAGRLSAGTAARLVRLADQLVDDVLPDLHPVLCHGDLHAGNVLAAAGRLVGIVDFAGAGWLDAAWDFVGVPLTAVPPMLDGYNAGAGEPDRLLERVAWCRLQTAVHRLVDAEDPETGASRALAEAEALRS